MAPRRRGRRCRIRIHHFRGLRDAGDLVLVDRLGLRAHRRRELETIEQDLALEPGALDASLHVGRAEAGRGADSRGRAGPG
jgi:hypothetical protein